MEGKVTRHENRHELMLDAANACF